MPKSTTCIYTIIVVFLTVLAGCGGRSSGPAATPRVTVSEVKSNPAFVGREVTLYGRVTHDLGVGPAGTFQLMDETGVIRVISVQALPLEGEFIEVDGTPRQLVVVGRRRELVLMANQWKASQPRVRPFEGTTKRP